MKVITENYADHCKMMLPWPTTSFRGTSTLNHQITVEQLPVANISIIILDVSTEITVCPNRKIFRVCAVMYCLCDFERIQNRHKKDTRLVKASDTIQSYWRLEI